MHDLKFLATAAAAMQISACCLPDPWVDQRFEVDIDPPARSAELDRYFVGETFVHVGVHSENPNYLQSGPPYWIGVSLREGKDSASSFTLHGLEIFIDNEPVTEFEIFDGSVMRDKRRPRELPTTFLRDRSEVSFRSFAITSPISLEFEDTRQIKVAIDIEVSGPNGSSRGLVSYEFTPRESSGFFQCLEV